MTIYQIWIEGGLHKDNLTKKQALRLEKEAASEGWNVVVLRVVQTVVGSMAVRI